MLLFYIIILLLLFCILGFIIFAIFTILDQRRRYYRQIIDAKNSLISEIGGSKSLEITDWCRKNDLTYLAGLSRDKCILISSWDDTKECKAIAYLLLNTIRKSSAVFHFSLSAFFESPVEEFVLTILNLAGIYRHDIEFIRTITSSVGINLPKVPLHRKIKDWLIYIRITLFNKLSDKKLLSPYKIQKETLMQSFSEECHARNIGIIFKDVDFQFDSKPLPEALQAEVSDFIRASKNIICIANSTDNFLNSIKIDYLNCFILPPLDFLGNTIKSSFLINKNISYGENNYSNMSEASAKEWLENEWFHLNGWFYSDCYRMSGGNESIISSILDILAAKNYNINYRIIDDPAVFESIFQMHFNGRFISLSSAANQLLIHLAMIPFSISNDTLQKICNYLEINYEETITTLLSSELIVETRKYQYFNSFWFMEEEISKFCPPKISGNIVFRNNGNPFWIWDEDNEADEDTIRDRVVEIANLNFSKNQQVDGVIVCAYGNANKTALFCLIDDCLIRRCWQDGKRYFYVPQIIRNICIKQNEEQIPGILQQVVDFFRCEIPVAKNPIDELLAKFIVCYYKKREPLAYFNDYPIPPETTKSNTYHNYFELISRQEKEKTLNEELVFADIDRCCKKHLNLSAENIFPVIVTSNHDSDLIGPDGKTGGEYLRNAFESMNRKRMSGEIQSTFIISNPNSRSHSTHNDRTKY